MERGKIICLGDSLTYGFPYGPHASWVTYAARACGFNLTNAGVNGNTLGDMAARFETDVLNRRPAAVIVLGGTNDAFRNNISRPVTLSFLEQMIRSALDNNIFPVIGLPMPIDDSSIDGKLERLCLEYRQVSARYGIPVLDFRASFVDQETDRLRDELYIDGAHPNLEGYRVMGETAVAYLTTAFARDIQAWSFGKQ